MPIVSVLSAGLIYLGGPRHPIRYDDNKEIDLTEYIPTYLKEEEYAELVSFFQSFLNEMYGQYIYTTSALDIEISARQNISILEKVNRISELHDPDYIDPEYIQFFANYLGYSVDLKRGELGVVTDPDNIDLCEQEDIKRYLSFVASNLPHWYKIKTTNNAIKIMLYSFGLIGDMVTRFTSDYQADNGYNWYNFAEGIDTVSDLPAGFYPTPHFTIRINIDVSPINFSFNERTRLNIFNAVDSIRPVNAKFDGIEGYTRASVTLFTRMYARRKVMMRIS